MCIRDRHGNNIGLVGLWETKIKECKVDHIAARLFDGWNRIHNFTHSLKGRIWVVWKPSSFEVTPLSITDQIIHCHVTQHLSNKHFHISFIYGYNHEQQRQSTWEDLKQISQSNPGAWCIIGDFNTVLYPDDRKGGNDIAKHELRELPNLMEECELMEMTCSGPYYSWTNKTTWSRIDWALINCYWHEVFDYTIAKYLSFSL